VRPEPESIVCEAATKFYDCDSSRASRSTIQCRTGTLAAVAAASGADEILMRYVGRTPLAKGSGTLALYHVQRSS